MFYLFLPETRNRTLEDIDGFFLGSKNPLQPVKVARTMPEGFAENFDLSQKGQPTGEHLEDVDEKDVS